MSRDIALIDPGGNMRRDILLRDLRENMSRDHAKSRSEMLRAKITQLNVTRHVFADIT